MIKWIGSALALAAMTFSGIACIGAPSEPTDESSAAPALDEGDGDESVGESSQAVAPGCVADGGCPAGGKTCGAWTAYYACSASYCTRDDNCAGCWGRPANCTNALGTPRNRTRACTMNASGQACTQYDYSIGTQCGGGC